MKTIVNQPKRDHFECLKNTELYYFANAWLTETATVAPTIGSLPIPIKPIIST